MEITERIKVYNEDCFKRMALTPDESIDITLIDPPYLYLKHRLDRPFDEEKFFNEVKRTLTKNGFLIVFGRGASFYRWGAILDELGFSFKEEIVWDKMRTTSPVTAIGRRHETISIWGLGNAKINRIRVPFIEKYKHEPEKIKETINRIATVFGNRKTFDLLRKYYEKGEKIYEKSIDGYNITRSKGSTINMNRTIVFARGLEEGITEQSIIDEVGDWHTSIHPTQKPVRLLERLLRLVIPKKDIKELTVADWFGGSYSTMKACHNLGLNGVSTEIDKEFHNAGIEDLKSHCKQLNLFAI